MQRNVVVKWRLEMKPYLLSLVVVCLFTVQNAAAQAIQGVVTNILTSSQKETLPDQTEHVRFGGCLVKMTDNAASPQNPANQAACNNFWVSGDCDNYFTSDPLEKRAQAKVFETIQLAYVTGAVVRLSIVPTQKHNGFCVVNGAEIK